jgi:hypothetical protein
METVMESRTRRGRRTSLALPAALVTAVLALGACARPAEVEPESNEGVATVATVAGSALPSVTLSDLAAQRLGIATDVVRDTAVDGQPRTTVPYSAVVYDPEGASFAYRVMGHLQFVRVPITVEFVAGDAAVLTDGPPSGTPVVTVGVSELFGTETGVGGE